MLVDIIIGMCVSPLTAQDGKFGEITCTKLRVVDGDGTTLVQAGVDLGDGYVGVISKDGERKAEMNIGKHGGWVQVWGKHPKNIYTTKTPNHNPLLGLGPKASLSIDENANGTVSIWDKNGYCLATLK